jgi:hypothetical protein
MNAKKKLLYCLIVNFLLLLFTGIIIIIFKGDFDDYFQYGPNENLNILSVNINTWKKYYLLQFYLFIVETANCIIIDIANPIMGFSIFNPDKKVIHDFGKVELQIYANLFWLISALRSTINILISISQFDIALLRVIYSELASVYTIRLLLNEKQFSTSNDYVPIVEMV